VSLRVFVSAGEPSGDALGGALVRAMRVREPSLRAVGMGGGHLASAGMDCTRAPPAVSGLVEVARHVPRLLALE